MLADSLDEIFARIKNLEDIYGKEPGTNASSRLCYRGHSKSCYKLIPSITRAQKCDPDPIVDNERIYVGHAMKHEFFKKMHGAMNFRALLQHHHYPTRVLDISGSYLIALYFACKPEKHCGRKIYKNEGELIVFRRNEPSTDDNIIAEIIAASSDIITDWDDYKLVNFYEKAKQLVGFVEPDEVRTGRMSGADWIREQCSGRHILYADAEAASERQKVQQACYIVFPNKIRKDDDGGYRFDYFKMVPLEDYEDHSDIVDRIQIPAKLKPEVIKYVRHRGITQRKIDSYSRHDKRRNDRHGPRLVKEIDDIDSILLTADGEKPSCCEKEK